MTTAFKISSPHSIQKRSKSNKLNRALVYRSLICMQISASGSGSKYENIFEEKDSKNEASVIISEIYKLTREKLANKLDLISKLSSNWDGYGAPSIGKLSIAICRNLISKLSNNIIIDVNINPTEFGGTQLVYENPMKKTKISVDFGDKVMSFYTIKGTEPPQFYSFLPYNEKNIELLISLLENRIA